MLQPLGQSFPNPDAYSYTPQCELRFLKEVSYFSHICANQKWRQAQNWKNPPRKCSGNKSGQLINAEKLTYRNENQTFVTPTT